MESKIPKISFKKPPYFKAGTLVFKDSGHELVLSDRHYRCLKSTHRKCNVNGERQINSETLERAFGRYATKFKLEKEKIRAISSDILKNSLWDVIMSVDEMADPQEEVMSATTEVMLQDATTKKKIQQSDFEDFEKAFLKSQEADLPLMLCGFVINFVKVAGQPEKEASLGRNLDILTKKVFLSKEGKILEIELEPWGWYTMNYINRFVPEYLNTLRENGVKLVNIPNEYLNMPLREAAMKYGFPYNEETMGQDVQVMYGIYKFMKDMLTISFKAEPDQMTVAVPYMLDRMQNDPALRLIMQTFGLMGIKPVHKTTD